MGAAEAQLLADVGAVVVHGVGADAELGGDLLGGLVLGYEAEDPAFSGSEAIDAGTFEMGSNAPNVAPYFGSRTQQPVHSVTISQPFWMGRHEVTQAEYESLMGFNPSLTIGAHLPVDSVSWDDEKAEFSVDPAPEEGQKVRVWVRADVKTVPVHVEIKDQKLP